MRGENDPVTGNDDVSLANETDVSEEFSDRKLGEPVAEVILRNLAHFVPTLFSLSITSQRYHFEFIASNVYAHNNPAGRSNYKWTRTLDFLPQLLFSKNDSLKITQPRYPPFTS